LLVIGFNFNILSTGARVVHTVCGVQHTVLMAQHPWFII